jgi:hypothetical protein
LQPLKTLNERVEATKTIFPDKLKYGYGTEHSKDVLTEALK